MSSTSLSVTILGSSSARPAFKRHPTAQIVENEHQLFLVDCGEGTQMQCNRYRIKIGRIDHIFISHLHGDHHLGILPLLDTFTLNSRTKTLHLFAPPDLKKIIDLHLSILGHSYSYPIEFYPIQADESKIIFENENIYVKTIILDHKRIECTGFLFQQKVKDRKMLIEKIAEYDIPVKNIPLIKKGADFITQDGRTIPNKELTLDPPPVKSYAFCSDTAYTESILPVIQNCNLLYHEATYLEELKTEAGQRGHATAREAALIAQKANAGQLLIGHFSSRYKDLQPFLNEARAVFKNTQLAKEGNTYQTRII